MTTSTENVSSFCGVPYLEFPVPAAYANHQKKAERKYTELRIQEKSSSGLKSYQVVLEPLFFPMEVIFFSHRKESTYGGWLI